MTDFREGALLGTPYSVAAPKRPILNSVKGCFNKHGCNFDEIRKIGYSRPSSNKFILKQRYFGRARTFGDNIENDDIAMDKVSTNNQRI